MVDMTAIGIALNSLKTATEIAQALIGIRDAEAFRGKALELQGVLVDANARVLAAQAAQAQCADRVHELERKLAKLEDWEREKERYELVEFPGGALAYAGKEAMRGMQPMHYLCANCIEDGKKSILQGHTNTLGIHMLTCRACGVEIERGLDPNWRPG